MEFLYVFLGYIIGFFIVAIMGRFVEQRNIQKGYTQEEDDDDWTMSCIFWPIALPFMLIVLLVQSMQKFTRWFIYSTKKSKKSL